MIKLIQTGLISAILLTSSCSLFPDKEKQYLQHSEFATLELPADLQQSVENDQTEIQNAQSITDLPEQNPESVLPSDASDKDIDQIPLLVDIGKEPIHIKIFNGFEESWSNVGKTLTHMGLEVLDRDKDNGQFFLVYEKVAKPVDDSLWSMLAFWQDDGQHEEFDFRVKLLPNVDTTKVIILDAEEQPITEGPGRDLLKKIYQAL